MTTEPGRPDGLPLDAVDNIAVITTHATGTDLTAAQRRLGDALRALSCRALGPDLDDAGRDQLASALEDLTAGLPLIESSRYSADERTAFFETGAPRINLRGGHPIFGQGTALGIPVTIETEPQHLVGRFRFDARQEGIPGWAHGGYVCAMFDYLLGQTCLAGGSSGPTGTLTVRFEAPTPIGIELAFQGAIVERSGRKLIARGRIVDEATDTVCATAEAIFIGGAW